VVKCLKLLTFVPVEQIEVSADIGAACDEIGKLIEAKRNADKG